ncbi:MAG: membrane protein insertion efficiency factor YidD [Euzebyales bacterium]|nr:membrane protein insertion efficiency factor YidD [Euzebyales bacterium]
MRAAHRPPGARSARASFGQRALVTLVISYRSIPKSGPPRCRFAPTCSEYALDALREHGALRGSWLTVRRLARCHPFHAGGLDYVPPSAPAHRNQGVRT